MIVSLWYDLVLTLKFRTQCFSSLSSWIDFITSQEKSSTFFNPKNVLLSIIVNDKLRLLVGEEIELTRVYITLSAPRQLHIILGLTINHNSLYSLVTVIVLLFISDCFLLWRWALGCGLAPAGCWAGLLKSWWLWLFLKAPLLYQS